MDDLVFEFDEQKPGAPKTKLVVYCVGCDKSPSGCDPNHIKAHVKDYNVHKISSFSWSKFNRDFRSLLLLNEM